MSSRRHKAEQKILKCSKLLQVRFLRRIRITCLKPEIMCMKTYKSIPLKRYFLFILLLMCLGCQSRVVRKAAETIERDASLTCPPDTANRCAIPSELQELADSIKEHGVIQPLIVTRSLGPVGSAPYTLIAGERRPQRVVDRSQYGLCRHRRSPTAGRSLRPCP